MDEIERLRIIEQGLRRELEKAADQIYEQRCEIERLRSQICVVEIDRQPEPDLRRAMFKAFGEEDDGHRNQ